MRFSRVPEIIRILTTTVFSLSLFSVSATDSDLTALLPHHASMVAEANFTALSQHPQKDIIFTPILQSCGKIVNRIRHLLVACDHNGKRRIMFGQFTSPETANRLFQYYADRTYSGNICYLRGRPGDRRTIRMARIRSNILGIYTAYPADQSIPEIPSADGCRISTLLPKRNELLLWGVGVPESKKEFLKDLRYFDFALENDIDNRPLLHGQLICRDALSALAAELFFRQAVPFLLYKEYNIGLPDTLCAINALQLKRHESKLTFSTRQIEPVIKIIARILQDEMSSFKEAVR